MPKGYLQYNLEDRSVTQLYCINSIFNDFKDKAPIPNEDELNHAKEQISRDLVQNLRGKYYIFRSIPVHFSVAYKA